MHQHNGVVKQNASVVPIPSRSLDRLSPSRDGMLATVRSISAVVALTLFCMTGPAPHAAALPLAGPLGDVPLCEGVGTPRTLVHQPRTFEAATFDQQGRLLLSDWLGNKVDIIDRPGMEPRTLAHNIYAPGGLAPTPSGTVLVGSGIGAPALLAPTFGFATLFELDPRTGGLTVHADGLSMGNGVVRADDGTVFSSNDLVPSIDRVAPDGAVQRGWYHETPANGLALSRDGGTLFANVSLGDTRILAIDTTTGKARTHFRPPAGLQWVFLDDLEIDSAGRLYAPTYFGGQVWRIDTDGSFCALTKDRVLPAGITLGRDGAGFSSRSVYVTAHAGEVIEIPNAVPSER